MKCVSYVRGGRKPAEPVAAGEEVSGSSRWRITRIMEQCPTLLEGASPRVSLSSGAGVPGLG